MLKKIALALIAALTLSTSSPALAVDSSRDEAIAAGYDPCKVCKP